MCLAEVIHAIDLFTFEFVTNSFLPVS